MNSFPLIIALNFSIAIPAFLGIFNFKRDNKSFFPFIILIWFGLFNESLSLALIYRYGANHVNSNIYVLIEFWIILYQFYVWNSDAKTMYILIGAAGLAIWIIDNFVIHTITANNSFYRMAYSLFVLLFTIDQINRILIFEKRPLMKNAIFLICLGFFISYSCKAFTETFNLFDPGLSSTFLVNLWFILNLVNCICNLTYATAIICIPTRQEFTLPF